MPELPELEFISEFLTERIVGRKIADINIIKSICIRTGKEEFVNDLIKKKIQKIERIGKTLLFTLEGTFIFFNLMLTGRLQYLKENEKIPKKIHFSFIFDDGSQLRYYDRKKMGKIYHFNRMLPDGFLLDSPDILSISNDEFLIRFKRFSRSAVKDILINQKFVLGIGNAYSDEILYECGIHPLRKGKELSKEEIENLYVCCKLVLTKALHTIKSNFDGKTDEENREFMKVHGKKDLPCPKCGKSITSITANKRILNFCRNCQK